MKPYAQRPKRIGLFQGWCTVDGKRRRVTRKELAEAYRLISKHRDIYTGKALR